MDESPERTDDPIDSAMAEFHAARKAGAQPDPEAFCKAHPDCEDELRARIENFLLVAGRLPELGKSPFEEATESDTGSEEDTTGLPFSRLDDFRLIREIGRGGMGVVYEAEQLSLNRKVALKVLPDHLSFSNEAVLKFRREAEAGGRQRHPSIVSVIAVGRHEGTHFIAQELVEGGATLADELEDYQKEKTLPIGYFRKCARIIAQVAEALGHAHESGVIHRDIKPSNILLTGEGDPKVTDFGLAKVEDALALSRTGDLAGTPYYMSPEQASSRRGTIDLRSDVYSLGVTLYEILTLQRPFEGETSQEILRKIIHSEPRDPRRLSPRVPRDLSVICLKAIEKDPRRRYQDMCEFGGDLERYLHGEVIRAKPAGAMTRIVKRIKRHPALSAAVGVAAVAVLALIGTIPWYIVRINAEKAEAQLEAEKTKAINEFLTKMLASPDPARDGRDVKAVELLDKAVESIDEDFSDQPEIAASLRMTIGNTYLSLAQSESAIREFRKSIHLFEQIRGNVHESTIIAWTYLAIALTESGKHDEAEALIRKAAQYQDKLSTQGRLKVLNDMAIILMNQSNYIEAEPILWEISSASQAYFGNTHSKTMKVLNNLTQALFKLGKSSEGEDLLWKILDRQQQTFGKRHVDTLSTMNNLAIHLLNQNKLSEAESLLQELVEYRRDIYGEGHPKTLTSMNNLASLLYKQNRSMEAESIYKESIEIRTRVLGEEHADTLQSMNNLATVLKIQGKVSEAETMLIKVIDIRSRVLGKGHPNTLSSMNNLGKILFEQEKYSEAEQLWRRCIEIDEQTPGYKSFPALLSRIHLGNLLAKLERFDEAEGYLLTGYKKVERALGKQHKKTREAFDTLIRLYEAWNKPEKVEELRRESGGMGPGL